MLRALALPLAVVALQTSVQPLSPAQRGQLAGRFWHKGCPVSLAQLRVLTVRHWGFDGRTHTGQLVVNAKATAVLGGVFERLYRLRFPIRHLRFSDAYGKQPADGDISGSFECRQAVPSPCSGGSGTGTWSNHADGLAVDINPVENPYVGCGMSRDPKAQSYRKRSPHRAGMVTLAVRHAFESVGWGWGGGW